MLFQDRFRCRSESSDRKLKCRSKPLNSQIQVCHLILNTSLTNYLKDNLKNKHYLIAFFSGLTDNPFKFTDGVILACYYDTYSGRARVLAFEAASQQIDFALISI